MKHLFLEGPIQTGKSTLIRKALKPYLASAPCCTIGGFASQRLTDPSGSTRAFRIAPADAPLTAPFSDYYPCAEDAPSVYGIFKTFYPDNKPVVDYSVFETHGIRYLRDTDGKRLMLLDEIGGHELTSAPFMDALYQLLAGDIPCIGVIKLPDSTKRMDAALLHENARLHERITSEFDGKILYYERGDESVRAIVDAFLADQL